MGNVNSIVDVSNVSGIVALTHAWLRRSPQPQTPSATLRDKALQLRLGQLLKILDSRRRPKLMTFDRLAQCLIQPRDQRFRRSDVTFGCSVDEMPNGPVHLLRFGGQRLGDNGTRT